MANLLTRLQDKSKFEANEETVSVTINSVARTKDDNKVILKCKEGSFYCFVNVLPDNRIPVINKPVSATLLLRESGEYVNIVNVAIDIESMGKYNMAATFKNAIVL